MIYVGVVKSLATLYTSARCSSD